MGFTFSPNVILSADPFCSAKRIKRGIYAFCKNEVHSSGYSPLKTRFH